MRHYRTLLVTGLIIALCVSGVKGVNYDTQIQPILTGKCAIVGCHSGGFPTGGLNLSTGVSQGNLVSVISSGYSPVVRVKPGDTLNSVLWHKLNGTGTYGVQMPFGGLPLSQSELNLITAWIVELGCCTGTTGNVNQSGIVDLSDLSSLVSYLTGGGFVIPCSGEANVNSSGIVDLSDLSSLVSYLTGGGFVLPNCL